MAQAGYTPIQLYYSTTASAAPTAANLLPGELGLNITDGKLYYEDNLGAVQLLASKAGASGSVTSVAMTVPSFLSVSGSPITSSGTLAVSLSGTALPVANGGTGLTTTPANGALDIGNGTGFTRTTLTAGTGVSITNGSGSITINATGTGGTVTTVSVASANGFAGTVANATTTPAITLSTSVTGVLKGNGTAISAATAGTDYVAPGTATTFTALQTFSGTSSNAAMTLANAKEVCTISATAATGTINYDVTTQSVLYYTSNASANWTVNFRGSSGTSLNTLMNTGESITLAFLVTQGATAYYNNAVTVDGASVTPKYQGGTAWSAGNASGVDAYVYTIVKTGSAAFTVFASQTQFK